jgi:murein DD-endopeptidase MepM/ murein hydrolase activator NlpD
MFKNRMRPIPVLMEGNWQKRACSVKRFFKRIHIMDGLLVLALIVFGTGLGLVFQKILGSAEDTGVKQENRLLREQNQLFQDQLDELKKKVNTIEDLSKELSRAAGKTDQSSTESLNAAGGPEAFVENDVLASLKTSTTQLELQLRDLKLDFEREQIAQAAVPKGLPAEGFLTDRFGGRRNPFGEGYEYHTGIDIGTSFGSPVRATADGLVIYAAPHNGYGNVVVIDHGNALTTRYGHLSAVTAQLGQRVRRGDQIGRAGSTGRSTGTHVHYEIRHDSQPLNPLNYIDRSLSK